jgi:hypothetical protein
LKEKKEKKEIKPLWTGKLRRIYQERAAELGLIQKERKLHHRDSLRIRSVG